MNEWTTNEYTQKVVHRFWYFILLVKADGYNYIFSLNLQWSYEILIVVNVLLDEINYIIKTWSNFQQNIN